MNRSPVRLTIFAASPVYYQAPLYRVSLVILDPLFSDIRVNKLALKRPI